MPVFQVTIERNYTVREGFSRFIEAASPEEAEEAAARLAGNADDDVPDDCTELGGGDSGEFRVSHRGASLIETPAPGLDVIKASEV